MNRLFIPTLTLVFCGLLNGAAFAQQVAPQAQIIFPPPPPPQYIQLEPGDVILSVNGRQIHRVNQLVQEVNRSGPVLQLTVRDRRTGRVIDLATRLNRRGPRLGITASDDVYRGVMIRQVFSHSAAQRCWRDNGGPGGPPVWPQPDNDGVVISSNGSI